MSGGAENGQPRVYTKRVERWSDRGDRDRETEGWKDAEIETHREGEIER